MPIARLLTPLGSGARTLPGLPSAMPRMVAGRVSIVLPAYNCATTIAAAVESCLTQTYADVEVIVVNDGSTDGTQDVLDGFGTRIRVLKQDNGGLASARNAGIRAATGEFVAWMDGDDIATPERLSIQVRVLTSMPAITLVSSDFSAFVTAERDFDPSHISTYYHSVAQLGGIANIYRRFQLIDAERNTSNGSYVVRWGHVYELLLCGNFVHPPTVMVRRTANDEAGFFDETIRYSSDYDLIIRIARTGRLAFVDASLLRYRISETQMSHASAGGEMPLETVKILEKVRSADPIVYLRHPVLFQHRIAESFLLAAELIGQSDRLRALRLLWRGLRYKLLFYRALRVLTKVTLPAFAITAAKRVRLGSIASISGPVNERPPRLTGSTSPTDDAWGRKGEGASREELPRTPRP